MLVDGDYEQAAGSADALIQYTSGTTGRPKGATFTHDAVLMHAATNIQTIPALYTGATLVLGDVRAFDGAAPLG